MVQNLLRIYIKIMIKDPSPWSTDVSLSELPAE